MSSLAATQIPKPADEQAFERASVVLWRKILKDPNVQRNGRRGQRQDGVDLSGYRDRDPGQLVGVQCKLKGDGHLLTEKEVRSEIKAALGFRPALNEFFVVTTSPDDAHLQRVARELTADFFRGGRNLMVAVWGWETLQERIAEHPEAMNAFDPSFTPFAERLAGRFEEVAEQQTSSARSMEVRLAEIAAATIEVRAMIAFKPDATVAGDVLEAHLDAEIDGVRDLVAKANPTNAIVVFQRILARVEATASGRIVFRLKANMGVCHFVLGDDEAAASLLEEAYGHAPGEPRAVANMALSMLLRCEDRRLREFGSVELTRDPGNEQLAGLVVQAARRDDNVADPFDLLPAASRAGGPAIVARVDFLRSRSDTPAWWTAAREAAASFPEDPHARQFAAEAVVDEALRSPAFAGAGRLHADELGPVQAALDALVERWRAAVDGPGALRPEHFGLCCNILGAMLALGDAPRAAAIAKEARGLARDDGLIAIRAALVGFEAGDDALIEDSMPAIPDGPDADLLRFRLAARRGDWPGLVALEGREVPETERRMVDTASALARVRMSAPDFDLKALRAAVDGAAGEARACVLAAEAAAVLGQTEMSDRAYENALRAMAGESHRAARAMVARLAAVRGAWKDVVSILAGQVDPTRDGDELRLLASAHVNATPIRRGALAFFEMLPAQVARLPLYLQACGLMNYNRGALGEAETYLRRAMAAVPDLTSLLALTATLRRRGRSDLSDELNDVDADSIPGSPAERMALCHELLDAGRAEEAFALGYRVLKANPANPQVAQRYIGLALRNLSGARMPAAPVAAPDAWIRLKSDAGGVFEAVIEDDETLRGGSDVSSRHAFAVAAKGLAVGGTFCHDGALGTATWTLTDLKHKFVHALHMVTDTFETRFPDEGGFFTLSASSDDMTSVLEQVKRASEATRNVADLHIEKDLPLAFAGARASGGSIGLGQYIATIGADVATCLGSEAERLQVRATVLARRGRGAVLDAQAVWTAATLEILGNLKALFGTLVVPRSALDEILALRDRIDLDGDGITMAWRDGVYTRRDHTQENRVDDNARIERIVALIEEACRVDAVLAPDDPGDLALRLTEIFGPYSLDAAHLAVSLEATLLSEDLHYRQMTSVAVGATHSAWVQGVLLVARELRLIDDVAYDAASLGLAARHHGHVAFDAEMLARIVDLDDEGLERLTIAARYIGGASADLRSHISVVQMTLAALWSRRHSGLKEMRATGLLIDRLVGCRRDVRLQILAILWRGGSAGLREYVSAWAVGHLIPLAEALAADGTPDAWGRPGPSKRSGHGSETKRGAPGRRGNARRR